MEAGQTLGQLMGAEFAWSPVCARPCATTAYRRQRDREMRRLPDTTGMKTR